MPSSDSLPCPHSEDYVGRVSYPRDLLPPVPVPNASGLVCARTACQEAAADAVAELTGHRGQFVAMP